MTVAAFQIARPTSLAGAIGPFMALAVLAFLAGFGGYLILGPANVMGMSREAAAASHAVATPADVYVVPDNESPDPPKAV